MTNKDQTTNLKGVGSTGGLERVTKFDHPDLVGGIVWSRCELAWIKERIKLERFAEREACFGALEIVLLMARNGNYSGQEEAVQECIFALQERSNI